MFGGCRYEQGRVFGGEGKSKFKGESVKPRCESKNLFGVICKKLRVHFLKG
jgi:hypothetical protein